MIWRHRDSPVPVRVGLTTRVEVVEWSWTGDTGYEHKVAVQPHEPVPWWQAMLLARWLGPRDATVRCYVAPRGVAQSGSAAGS